MSSKSPPKRGTRAKSTDSAGRGSPSFGQGVGSKQSKKPTASSSGSSKQHAKATEQALPPLQESDESDREGSYEGQNVILQSLAELKGLVHKLQKNVLDVHQRLDSMAKVQAEQTATQENLKASQVLVQSLLTQIARKQGLPVGPMMVVASSVESTAGPSRNDILKYC